ncbi:MAG: hypothetical protein L7F78_16065 [Syntrophales bacterium LBB04]|nr:hypothetical protein [Syntrophales bacterium LBB04]
MKGMKKLKRCFMKSQHLKTLALILFTLIIGVNQAFSQDKSHEAAMSALSDFFADPSALAGQNLTQFSPKIQKRLEKIVLMIMQESIADASRHVEAMDASGPEDAFNSFSPAVRKEIQDLAKELEKDPAFMKSLAH